MCPLIFYYADGNLKSTRVATTTQDNQGAAGDIITTFEYDGVGNKTKMVDPDMGTWHYKYNAAGELIEQKNAKGQSVQMSYDNLGRLIWRWGGNDFSKRVYDTASGKGIGKLASLEDTRTGYKKSFTYTRFGQVASITEKLPTLKADTADVKEPAEYVTRNSYDKYGRLDVLVYPGDDKTRPLALKHHYEDTFRSGVLYKITDDRVGKGNKILWELTDTNAAGNITSQTLGNGVSTTRNYDKLNRVKGISTSGLQSMGYTYDKVGNLIQRKNNNAAVTEDFLYDNLYRLKQSQSKYQDISTPVTKTIKYDGHGNITLKDNKAYQYNPAHPHAVSKIGTVDYTYDANGNMASGDGRTISWTSFDKPLSISKRLTTGKINTSEMKYDADHARMYKKTTDLSKDGFNRDTLYIGGGLAERERITSGKDTGKETYKYHLRVGGQNIGYITQYFAPSKFNEYKSETTRYLLNDHLGSVDVILSSTGSKIRNLSFNAWGERRLGNWQAMTPTGLESTIAALNRESMKLGFTGHEMDDAVGLINMKGRLYDAKIGRFISADPNIQAPTDTQSFNRYTYVKNNPLSYTDPSGYFFKKLFKQVGDLWRKVVRPFIALAVAIVLAPYLGPIGAGFVSGFVGGAIQTGSLKGAIQGGLFGAISGSLAHGVAYGGADGGSIFGLGDFGTSIAHGVAQGGLSALRGGKFGAGFLSSFTSHYFAPNMKNGDIYSRTARQAMIGGTVSAIVGGKFANGAVTAAFVHLFNSEASEFYEKLSQKQHAKVLANIRGEVIDELSKVKALMGQTETFTVEYAKLLKSHTEFAALSNKYSAASVLSQGTAIFRATVSKIPNLVGAGVGMVNRLENLSNYSVSGFIYQDPFDGKYHAGFNAFESSGSGHVFLRIDGY